MGDELHVMKEAAAQRHLNTISNFIELIPPLRPSVSDNQREDFATYRIEWLR